ncbi:MAG TPA: Rap1a/Tai family immunity protein [Stellaceae bacterium]|nr:Rap1a/Tai family immunity protein [Stellaceae bacterium]
MTAARSTLGHSATALSLACALAAAPAAAQPGIEPALTGRVLYAMCTTTEAGFLTACRSFVQGFLEGVQRDADMHSEKPFFCLAEDTDTDLVILAFTRQFERLPRTSVDEPAGMVLRDALWVAFPCEPAQ